MICADEKQYGESLLVKVLIHFIFTSLLPIYLDSTFCLIWGAPHIRHTAAMELLHHGVDRSVIALWLGHESVETTQIYLHADMRLKRKALSRITPFGVKPSLYKPNDELLAFLENL
ncbi:hypothetical protein DSCO28_02090 [Desulfosarcina ovata subsp. sediminis]|uniref:Tyr recombinase domain-containing protein n=1 Tax=Desulfosarcina ovata subsp. sediminis TaxID=885957 RepID=A0A5K7ZQK0_9BACT|nr:tyrosine-type recombinase/integrase [Desulfosarcina ovata]BBO79643.1 hypothetical protein DSCO28_02090 [Desulfosarcina ovata subsp. sediminis]